MGNIKVIHLEKSNPVLSVLGGTEFFSPGWATKTAGRRNIRLTCPGLQMAWSGGRSEREQIS